MKSLCYHCGESSSTIFVFGLEELQEKSLLDGYKYYSISSDCVTDRKDVVKHGKKDKMQAQKEKKDRAAKVKTTKEKPKDALRSKNSAENMPGNTQ